MQTDLMCATCERMKLKQRVIRKTFDRLVFRNGYAPATLGNNRHPLAVTRVAPNVRLDAARWRGRFSVDEREIGFVDFPQAELVLQPAMGALILRKQDQPRRLFIQS